MSPTTEGAWSLVNKSDIKKLDGKSAAFTCVKSVSANAHGRLRVDQEHPHHFILEDGAHFFMQGYEYDWLLRHIAADRYSVPNCLSLWSGDLDAAHFAIRP